MCSIAALAAHLFQAREQLVLAVEAAVGIVAHVVGVVELVRLDVLVGDAEAATKASASRLCDSGREAESAVMARAFAPSTLVRGPGQVGRIGAAGEGHDHAAHGAQRFAKSLRSFSSIALRSCQVY